MTLGYNSQYPGNDHGSDGILNIRFKNRQDLIIGETGDISGDLYIIGKPFAEFRRCGFFK